MSATRLISSCMMNVVPSISPASASPRQPRRTHADSVASRAPLGQINPVAVAPVSAIAEDEFMEAMKAYKAKSGRMFPTWSEVLEVLRELGYQKSTGLASPAASPERAEVERRQVARAS
jgi:hypothetical protein